MIFPFMQRGTLATALLLAAGLSSLFAQGTRVFELDPGRLRNLPPGVGVVKEGPEGGLCLRWKIPPESAADFHLVDLPVDISALRDHEILLSWRVRAEDVGVPATSHGGIKVQLHYNSPANGPQWFSEAIPSGTFAWTSSALIIRVDADAEDARLQLGLQDAPGTLWIDSVAISILRPRPSAEDFVFRGHNLPRLRGMVGPGVFEPRDFSDMRAMGANVVRWRLINTQWARIDIPSDPARYEPWLEAKLDELERVLADANAHGMKVLVDLHSPPGGRLPDGTLRMTLDSGIGEYYIEIWRRIASRFRGRPGLWAYDLMNEPVQKRPSPPGVRDWYALQEDAARAVRAIDPDIPILIEADDWDSPQAFAWLRPVDIPRVVYSVHVYWPYEYTHQGFEKSWNSGEAPGYPGKFNGRPFDKAAIARQLESVRAFQKAANAHIFVGEFSVARWAPGGERYLEDCISLFEEYGWDWTYHAFRESDAWSLEHENLPHPDDGAAIPAASTGRKSAVVSRLRKNRFQ